MPLRPTRPQMPTQASSIAAGRRPAMPSQATTRPSLPSQASPVAALGKIRSAAASAFGKTTATAAKAGTLSGAGVAARAKAKGSIGPANTPKLTPVTRRGKGFTIREPRQRGER